MKTATATLIGTVEKGALETIPLIAVSTKRPKFRNNGYNCFSGQADLRIPGLSDALPDEGRPIRQNHVCLRYADGKEFLTYTSTLKGNDIYSFC